MPDLKIYARDPVTFFQDLVIPSAVGDRRFRDVMAPYQLQWFRDIAPSLASVARNQPPPFTRFWCERTKGGSKDSDTACCLLWLLAFSKRPLDMQVGASDRDQAAELRKAATDILRLNSWLSHRVASQAWTLSCRATNSSCDIIASDVAGSHGARPDVVVLNELSHVTKEEFASNLMDNATKKPNGLVIIATNSGFVGTWQHSWRELARTSDRWHFHALAEPPPWLSAEVLDEAQRRNSVARFQRLFHGVWPSQSGDALDPADVAACTDSSLKPAWRRDPSCFYVLGCDLGIRHDHSAVVVVGCNRRTQLLHLAYAESWAPAPATGRVDLIRIEQTILQLHKKFALSTVAYDPFQAALLAQRLEQARLKTHEMVFSGTNLNLMASTLLEIFRGRRIRLFPHDQLVRDLGRLTLEEKSYGWRLSATRDIDGHADVATALAIALPVAIDIAGSPPARAGMLTDPGETPMERALGRLQREHEFDMYIGSRRDDGNDEWRAAMKFVGRR